MNYHRDASETRILTTFPTEGLPSPTIIPAAILPPVRRDPSNSNSNSRAIPMAATELNRWFCCRCAQAGYTDPVGIQLKDPLGRDYAHCFRSPLCRHARCPNCLVGPSHRRDDGVRTVGGLHTSPRFVDPVFWACACGEWAWNIFGAQAAAGHGSCVLGVTRCGNPGCAYRWAVGGEGVLRGGSLVLNRFGQVLGSADQRSVVLEGPWFWQRRGLGDERCLLIEEFRPRGLWKEENSSSGGGSLKGEKGKEKGKGKERMVIAVEARPGMWREGERVPRCYAGRPGPPAGKGEEVRYREYEVPYLMGLPAGKGGVDTGQGLGVGIVGMGGNGVAGPSLGQGPAAYYAAAAGWAT
ncbi:hypothetical protein B0T22DRAFT_521458 [Podospora appendiculata]|uniref:Uncharacterized protein n=1 Tax=Podospora appendiculata TaxID=314037 RepID=A0AAE1C812_9PEZI|nr:hypothetical protein B0T22DRAFT_521458 [Podospora appendiculata]